METEKEKVSDSDSEKNSEECEEDEGEDMVAKATREQFVQSMKAMEQVCKILRCVKCAGIPTQPREKVYTLGNCFHKYCASCVESMSGKPCVVCDVVGRLNSSLEEDAFSSSLIDALMALKEEMKNMSREELNEIELGDEEASPPLDIDLVTGGPIVPRSATSAESIFGWLNDTTAAQDESSPTTDNIAPTSPPKSPMDNNVRENSPDMFEDSQPSPVVAPNARQNKKRANCSSDASDTEDPPDLVAADSPSRPTKKSKSSPESDSDVDAADDDDDDTDFEEDTFNSTPEMPKLTRMSPDIDTTIVKSSSQEAMPGNTRRNSTRSTVSLDSATTPALGKRRKIAPKASSQPVSLKSTKHTAKSSSKTVVSDETKTISPYSTPIPAKRGDAIIGNKADSPASLGSASFSSTTGKVDKKNAKGETPLHIACRSGQVEKVKQLILAGADPNVQDYAGWTPLHEAINGKASPSCKFELVKLLCEGGSCNPNIPGMDNESAIHEASRGGFQDIVVYLLDYGASPNIRNRVGNLPRDVAATEEIAKLFEDSSIGGNSPDISFVDDPVVLEIQLSNALIYFNCDVSPEELSYVENTLKLKVTKTLQGEVTHMIFNCDSEKKVQYSYDYLHGIANGLWMLSMQWINDSIEAKKVLSPSSFEVQSCDVLESERSAPTSARTNKELGNPGLFHGFCFYLYKNSAFDNIGKTMLAALVKSTGGEVINREPNPSVVDPLEYPIRFHVPKQDSHKLTLTSHIILYDDKNKPPASKMHNMEHIKVLKVRWMIDSLGDFSLKDPDNYLS